MKVSKNKKVYLVKSSKAGILPKAKLFNRVYPVRKEGETRISNRAKIHSFESFSTLDGPGIRFVIFFSGCPLRCNFCHNIDMVEILPGTRASEAWKRSTERSSPTYQKYSVLEVMEKIKRTQPYFKNSLSGGGVTLSGGEPFFQFEFILELLKKCKKLKIHTVIDTSLYTSPDKIREIEKWVNLFLVGLKHIDNQKHKKLTGKDNKLILKNIFLLNSLKKLFRIRYVVVPGINDNKKDIEKLAKFLSGFKYLEAVELLPYHRLGIKKWKALNIPYKLSNVKLPTEKEMRQVKEIFQTFGISVL